MMGMMGGIPPELLKYLQGIGGFGGMLGSPQGQQGGQGMPPTQTFGGFPGQPQGGGMFSQMAQQLGRGQGNPNSPFVNPGMGQGRMQIPQPIGWPSGPGGGFFGGAR